MAPQKEWAFLFFTLNAMPACSKPLDLRSLGAGGWRRQAPCVSR